MLNTKTNFLTASKQRSIKKILLLFFCIGVVLFNTVIPAHAENVFRYNLTFLTEEIKGRLVNSETKGPLAYATITVKGTTTAVKSDDRGFFSIQATIGDVLLITYAGSQPFSLKVTSSELGEVSITVEASALDEVQVIAYGKTSRRLSTGNVSTVKAAEIERQPVNNPLLALAGRVPGLVIAQGSGYSGTAVRVQIQGINNITNTVGSDPLFIINGVPYPSRLLPTVKNLLGFPDPGNKGPNSLEGLKSGAGSPFSFINPGDIESIDILKDADATAIYGTRAANGAILITTKKGKPGKTIVDINMQRGSGKTTRMMKLLGTQDYLSMRREAMKNSRTTVIPGMDYDLDGTWDSTRYTDWQKVLLGGTAGYTDLQANVSGGTERTQFFVGGAFHHETTVLPANFYNTKGSLHFSLNNSSENQRFRFQLSGAYMSDINKLPDYDVTTMALLLAPVAPHIYLADGNLNWAPAANGTATWVNPLAMFAPTYTIRTKNLVSSAVLSYQVFKGFEIKSSFGYSDLQSDESAISPSMAVPPANRNTQASRSSFNGTGDISSWIIEPQATYKIAIGKGRLETLIGSTILKNKTALFQYRGTGYPNDLVINNIRYATTVSDLIRGEVTYRNHAVFGRLNYNWQDKYLLNFTYRRDGSSRFGSANPFHDFGALGLAWIFSKGNFIEKHAPILSFGKLRGSYGTTGNDQISDYQYKDLYRTSFDYSTGGPIPVPYQGITALTPGLLPNRHLQWEETRKLQFGLDLGFIKDRILINANYYRNTTDNQVLTFTLPAMTGFDVGNATFFKNYPVVLRNYGWEFSLATVNIRKRNFSWTSNLNLSIPHNKLVEFKDLALSNFANTLAVGYPITIARVYHYLGTNPTTGLPVVADKDGNQTSNPNSLTDRTVYINTGHRFDGGMEQNFGYKDFNLSFFFQFVQKSGRNYLYGFNNTPGAFNSVAPSAGLIANAPDYVLDRWRKPGDISNFPRFETAQGSSTWGIPRGSDVSFSDASYMRLKNISLSWQFPKEWIKKARLQQARLYIHGQNLITITRYRGMDPESTEQGSSAGGIIALPPQKIFTAGIQITL